MKSFTKKLLGLLIVAVMLVGLVPTVAFANDECAHTDAYYTAPEGEPSCFEPGMDGYWFCPDCYKYLDNDRQNEYWEEFEVLNAVKKPATGHAFNADSGYCDNCGIPNAIYSRVTSLADVNEEDLYIFVAETSDGRRFVLGGLNESDPDERGNVWCGDSGNAVEVVPYEDGSISLLNQNYVGTMTPAEFMLDIDHEQFNSDLDDNFGLTPIMLKLPNYCIYPFQSHRLDDTGFMGIPRYPNGAYSMWDASEWIIDFYTTEVDENTYRDDMDGFTHAEQVARGNIGDNISEGDLLMYNSSFYSVGGAMFTLRFREYPNPETGVTEYYFICGEDWALEGSPGWDYITDTTPTNDTQYAISLYRYDVPSAPAHTCDFGNWVNDGNGNTHTHTCSDPECGKSETLPHVWDSGVKSDANCTEDGSVRYTCIDCGATKTNRIPALGHKWNDWTYSDSNSHTRTCSGNCGLVETDDHSLSNWISTGDSEHKSVCSVCAGEVTSEHLWNDGEITTDPTDFDEGVKTYTCQTCSHTRTEPIPPLGHDHSWSDWSEYDAKLHIRSCICNATQTDEHNFDDGAVIDKPTHTEVGHIKYTCIDCGYSWNKDIPTLTEHTFGDWQADATVSDGHYRECICGEIERENCSYDNGKVTGHPTHLEEGEMTYTCTVCKRTYTDSIPKTEEHTFGEWICDAAVVGSHYRECTCGERETESCLWNEGEITTEPTYEAEGVKTYTCTICGGIKTESIPKLIEVVENLEAGVTLDVVENSNVSIPAGTVIDVVEKPTEEISEQIIGEIAVNADGAAKPLAIYDLSLLLDGAEVQPGGTVVVTLPAPDLAAEYDSIVVVFIAPDGSYEECKTTVNDDGTISFETNHFSRYAVIGITNNVAEPNNSLWIIISVLVALLVVGAVAAMFIMKRHNDRGASSTEENNEDTESEDADPDSDE